jgi:hypothetical protein
LDAVFTQARRSCLGAGLDRSGLRALHTRALALGCSLPPENAGEAAAYDDGEDARGSSLAPSPFQCALMWLVLAQATDDARPDAPSAFAGAAFTAGQAAGQGASEAANRQAAPLLPTTGTSTFPEGDSALKGDSALAAAIAASLAVDSPAAAGNAAADAAADAAALNASSAAALVSATGAASDAAELAAALWRTFLAAYATHVRKAAAPSSSSSSSSAAAAAFSSSAASPVVGPSLPLQRLLLLAATALPATALQTLLGQLLGALASAATATLADSAELGSSAPGLEEAGAPAAQDPRAPHAQGVGASWGCLLPGFALAEALLGLAAAASSGAFTALWAALCYLL